MTHKLIKTDNYLLVVDDSEIKKENYYLNNTGNVVEKLKHRLPGSGQWCKKIIANLPLNGSPILEGVDLLPPIDDDDVEQLALDYVNSVDGTDAYYGFIAGYEKAKKSINQYPTEFECEMEWVRDKPDDEIYQVPKTITTAQGTQWVGKYNWS